jgi:hypothetical protein
MTHVLVDAVRVELMLSKLTATAIVFFWNYLARRHYVFRSSHTSSDAQQGAMIGLLIAMTLLLVIACAIGLLLQPRVFEQAMPGLADAGIVGPARGRVRYRIEFRFGLRRVADHFLLVGALVRVFCTPLYVSHARR